MTTIVEPNPVGVVNPTRIRWRPPKLTPSLVFKTVFGVVVLGGLVYFVGGQVLLETAIKIVVAVGVSVGLFIVANKLFDLAYPTVGAVLRPRRCRHRVHHVLRARRQSRAAATSRAARGCGGSSARSPSARPAWC